MNTLSVSERIVLENLSKPLLYNMNLDEIRSLGENCVSMLEFTKSEQTILESINSDIKNIKTYEQAEEILNRLVKAGDMPLMFKILKATCYLLSFIGAYGLGWGLLGKYVLTGAMGASVGSVATAIGIEGGIWLTITSSCKLLASIFGIMLLSIGAAKFTQWLFQKICEKFFNTEFMTAGQRTQNFKLFINVMEENILLAKKAGNKEQVIQYEYMRDRAKLLMNR